MQIKVVYNREVLDDGDFVTSADVFSDEDLNKLADQIKFTVKEKTISLKNVVIRDNRLHVDFDLIPELSTLKFDVDKFINRLALPQILLQVENVTADISVCYQRDPFLDDFKQGIIQTDKTPLSYAIYDSRNTSEKRPLILFLHGSGERGFNNEMQLLGNDVPKTMYEYAKNKEDAVILAPQATWAPTLNGWFRKEFREALMQLLNKVIKDSNIDAKRIYLSGLSNGGSTTWYMGAKHSDIFAAIVPCSGYVYDDGKKAFGEQGKGRYMLVTDEEAKALSTLPIWAFHAEDDPTVGVLGSKKAAEAIGKYDDSKLKVTIYPKGTVKPNPHASWAFAYNNPDLLPWLFAQHK